MSEYLLDGSVAAYSCSTGSVNRCWKGAYRGDFVADVERICGMGIATAPSQYDMGRGRWFLLGVMTDSS